MVNITVDCRGATPARCLCEHWQHVIWKESIGWFQRLSVQVMLQRYSLLITEWFGYDKVMFLYYIRSRLCFHHVLSCLGYVRDQLLFYAMRSISFTGDSVSLISFSFLIIHLDVLLSTVVWRSEMFSILQRIYSLFLAFIITFSIRFVQYRC